MHPKTPSFKIASVCGCVILLLFISLFLSGEDNYNNSSNHNGIDPPRDILTGNLNCDCDRGVFSVSITKNFGNIFFTAIFAGILSAIAVFAAVAAFAYKSRKKHAKLASPTNSEN